MLVNPKLGQEVLLSSHTLKIDRERGQVVGLNPIQIQLRAGGDMVTVQDGDVIFNIRG